jgi:hypothetical protein
VKPVHPPPRTPIRIRAFGVPRLPRCFAISCAAASVMSISRFEIVFTGCSAPSGAEAWATGGAEGLLVVVADMVVTCAITWRASSCSPRSPP